MCVEIDGIYCDSIRYAAKKFNILRKLLSFGVCLMIGLITNLLLLKLCTQKRGVQNARK